MARNKSFCEAEVLEKALQLFHKNGYESVSIQDLVDELGISRSSLYDTYGSKEELFLKALQYYRKGSAKTALKALEDPVNASDALEDFFYSSLSIACNDPEKKGCMMVNSVLEGSGDLVPSVGEIVRSNTAEVREKIASVIRLGQKQGSIRQGLDPTATASMLFALHSGLIAQSRIDPEPDRLRKALKIGLDLVKAAV